MKKERKNSFSKKKERKWKKNVWLGKEKRKKEICLGKEREKENERKKSD